MDKKTKAAIVLQANACYLYFHWEKLKVLTFLVPWLSKACSWLSGNFSTRGTPGNPIFLCE